MCRYGVRGVLGFYCQARGRCGKNGKREEGRGKGKVYVLGLGRVMEMMTVDRELGVSARFL